MRRSPLDKAVRLMTENVGNYFPPPPLTHPLLAGGNIHRPEQQKQNVLKPARRTNKINELAAPGGQKRSGQWLREG